MTLMIFLWSLLQTTTLSWSCQADVIVGDQLDQWYCAKGSTLEKRDSAGNVLFTYSAPSLGPIEHVDTFNPLKPFVFYPDLGKVVYLNTLMAPIDPEINLFEFRGQITMVAGSIGQHIWLYDTNEMSVTRYDQFMVPTATTGTLRTWVSTDWNTAKMTEANGLLYLWNGIDAVLVFDLFGNYVKEMKLPRADEILFTQEGMIIKSGNVLSFQSYGLPEPQILSEIELSEGDQIAFSAKYIARYDESKVLLVRGRVLD